MNGASAIEYSFGISVPQPAGDSKDSQQPTLMRQLQIVESILRGTAESLENIHRHVNG